jgi:CheY-like chemotaxis protein
MESVGRLAGGIAHDFNNILSVILSLTDVSLRAAVNDPLLTQDLEMISEAGQRAARLTQQLLAFSRKQVLQPVPLDLGEALRGMKDLLHRLLGEDIVVRFELPPGVGTVSLDPGQLEQVLLNLSVNARDAMPHGGTLTIAARRTRLDGGELARFGLPSPGEFVLFTVSDTGNGMDAATREHIFEPFFTTKVPGAGTGLGLATVYGIVTQSGGAITVSSAVGRGTTFEIAFPAWTVAPRASEPKPPPRPGRGTGATVLVVEDDELVRTVACRILERAGYTVRAIGDPKQALALTREELSATHLVLSDVIMPGLSGPAMVEQLRERRPGLPALFMSGYPDDKLGQHGVLDSSVKLVAKPLTPEKLLRQVAEALAGK